MIWLVIGVAAANLAIGILLGKYYGQPRLLRFLRRPREKN